MQTTLELLDAALKKKNAREWAEQLKLSTNALRTAKHRGNLSPAIAGALAEELGEPVEKWIVIAALESERDSACKSRMMRKFLGAAALAGAALAPVGAASAATVFDAANSSAVYYVKSLARKLRARFESRKLMGINAPCMPAA